MESKGRVITEKEAYLHANKVRGQRTKLVQNSAVGHNQNWISHLDRTTEERLPEQIQQYKPI